MKDIRCLFGKHSFGESVRDRIIYQYVCGRCGKTETDQEKTDELLDTLFIKEPATLPDGTRTVKISVRDQKANSQEKE